MGQMLQVVLGGGWRLETRGVCHVKHKTARQPASLPLPPALKTGTPPPPHQLQRHTPSPPKRTPAPTAGPPQRRAQEKVRHAQVHPEKARGGGGGGLREEGVRARPGFCGGRGRNAARVRPSAVEARAGGSPPGRQVGFPSNPDPMRGQNTLYELSLAEAHRRAFEADAGAGGGGGGGGGGGEGPADDPDMVGTRSLFLCGGGRGQAGAPVTGWVGGGGATEASSAAHRACTAAARLGWGVIQSWASPPSLPQSQEY